MDKTKDHIRQLADYVKKNLAKGYTLDALKYSLISQGYSRISVEKAIELANKELAAQAPQMKEKPQITYKIIDEENKPVKVIEKKRGFWKKVFG